MRDLRNDLTSSKEKAPAFLVEAGIVTTSGELSKPDRQGSSPFYILVVAERVQWRPIQAVQNPFASCDPHPGCDSHRTDECLNEQCQHKKTFRLRIPVATDSALRTAGRRISVVISSLNFQYH